MHDSQGPSRICANLCPPQRLTGTGGRTCAPRLIQSPGAAAEGSCSKYLHQTPTENSAAVKLIPSLHSCGVETARSGAKGMVPINKKKGTQAVKHPYIKLGKGDTLVQSSVCLPQAKCTRGACAQGGLPLLAPHQDRCDCLL